MTNPMMQTWETYTATWKEGPPDQRKALFETALSTDCVYRDPLGMARGWEALAAYIADFHAQIPGGHFVTRKFASHHQSSFAHWNMVNRQGDVIGEGHSFGQYDDAGKLISMTGFYDVASPQT
jgi:hypothetical protein